MQAVFFDFDGVILDSVAVKTAAFAEMYADHGEAVRRAVVDYHLSHGGVSRHEKFRHFHEQLLGLPMTEALMARLCAAFSDLTLAKVMAAPFIPGARETLAALADRSVSAFVASGTPQAELEAIVLARLGHGVFAEVHGSPRTKVEIVRDVLARHGFAPARCVFVGDAMTDWRAARECAVPFVGVSGPSGHPFPDNTAVVRALSLVALENPSPVTEPA
ncbi:MAG: HAD hydrolase-like protein [Pseudodesulfovibrio sp.]|uniref:phosphoglycolate phosphatase n=1 Tax=Pseudodesulfovibrio aespoeensis (strain ATCC 700646 / DSM 10631 / Aspo-2) TaxID=643562 RepID=E6VUI7_PSEA9|nr:MULTISPECIES: HAD family hydrolase [Pseudodesulfovibrio]MBU4192643.1 HAD hydrolase-like protein [Pseudomonadota bacterium]ADU61132.1 Haloacid dehalogenase domain protein hydrolase [Pseudodesulfovibrio aespoeensis Aspo-2]MBU4244283.1 HAD hydrolase-like protein [Pseudomonadota bacterium]MBU4378600.1 HAD hydrolase-like protein [Pseudomonadota bacterium]MBU4476747.1 HAD hydrolase-like protein [Pseudomonadota bacterium]